MKFLTNISLFLFFLFFVDGHLVLANQELALPRVDQTKDIVQLVPIEYRKGVLLSFKKSWRNIWQLMLAIQNVSPQEREGMAFLMANMPPKDLRELKADFLVENVQLAYQSLNEVPWGKNIPKEIFLNDVLPYASINERRDNWRVDFHQRFIKIAHGSQGIDQAVKVLNKYVFDNLQVSYNATKRPKPDQSPYESIQAHYASCTGLSVLLIDALRSVGIPARLAGIALWADGSGNHTWVEVWDGRWRYIGADEPTELDHTWFSQKAASTDSLHHIYATSFKKTGLFFPMRWARHLKTVSAIDVTKDYTGQGRV